MKVAVLGAGAMGSLFGGLLAEAGNQVTLIDIWKEHVDAINTKGLKIDETKGVKIVKEVKATTDPSQVDPVELLIVFVKSTVTEVALESAKSIVGDNTTIITLQNGLGNIEKIEKAVGKGRVIAGVTSHGSTLLGPGRIRHAGQGDTYLGEIDGRITKRLNRIAEVFNRAGIKCRVETDILSLIWSKLIINVGINALTAITGLKNGDIVKYHETVEILEQAVKEAVRVAQSRGIKLQYDDPVAHTKEVCRLTAQNRSSMLQDVLNRRKTEIEMINGAVVREGEKAGIPTPVNRVLTNLVATIQKTYDLRQKAE